ncbi:contact-dependent growth inhibition system immunity protein [Nocardia sp. NPDC088792]|uniref:contact-dependent growth inhibition system immunity protein n=1 Tax=Nocardia sp. NPDC088792 TaxID=3364332 RepID=UPI003830BF90
MNSIDNIDRSKSIQDLEGAWPEPSVASTKLVETIYKLRKRPIGELDSYDIARLILQDVGLRWLMPIAVKTLRDTIPKSTDENWWYDDELLHAVITRDNSYWSQAPELARYMKATIGMLPEISDYLRDDIERFNMNISSD